MTVEPENNNLSGFFLIIKQESPHKKLVDCIQNEGRTMSWDWEKLQKQQQRQFNRAPTPPNWDNISEKFSKFKNFKVPGTWLIGLLLLLMYAGSSMFFTVDIDQVGVVQRFGKYHRTVNPGLNFKMPAGIEQVTKVKVKYVYKEEFGFRPVREVRQSRFLGDSEHNVSLMLTGDLNVAVVPWIVQYRIRDPYLYLFKVDGVRRLLRDLAEASMRLVAGDRSINEVISKREEIADQAKLLLQKELDHAETGIHIVTVEMKKTNVPQKVQPSFNEVNQAIQEKEKVIYQAKEDYNKAIPAAKGEAERAIKAAEGYALDRINRAQGDASRFISQYEQYVTAKDVTRRRMYLESMKHVYPKLGKVFVMDAEHNNILPLINLDTLSKKLATEDEANKDKKRGVQ
ncbi:MAG: Protein hflK [Candidatus Magnetoglobus multicellularis str. Araruama]|uniref:Protein HflK n=1 Tax=Candidatus Magnetoglobus multicellularis str. Araruama TaxID=890399 RepID=A0A1V1PHD7_9BACT|nr:MAG: Protein hflK [Candidatus Magnetoglobus multicellularis str. Araruama]